MPVCKPLGQGEVRSNLKDGTIARILFCIKGKLMILLHGFIKTPEKELEVAHKRLKEIKK